MDSEIWAVLDHYSSTPKNPKRSNYPKDDRSCWAFQGDIATGKRMYRPIKWPWSQRKIDIVRPVFIKITNEVFLDRCKQGCNQNTKESFNAFLWSLHPTEKCNSPFSLAINLTVCIYNCGIEYGIKNLLWQVNLEIGPSM